MLARIAVVVVLTVIACLLPACVEPPPPDAPKPLVKRADVVASSPSLSEVVIVEPSRLRVPSSARALLDDDVKVGSVVTGGPSKQHQEKNPYGYLRRVTKIEEVTNENVIDLHTSEATLSDLYEQGTIDFTLNAAAPPKTTTANSSRPQTTLSPLAFEGDLRATFSPALPTTTLIHLKELLPGNASADGTVSIGGRLSATPYVHGMIDFGVLEVTRFSAEMGLKYNLELFAEAKATLTAQRATHFNGGPKALKQQPSMVLAQGLVPGTLIWWSLRATLVGQCTLSAAAAVMAKATVGISAEPYVKVIYEKGQWRNENNLAELLSPTVRDDVTFSVEGNLGVRCEVTPRLGVYFFEAAGPYISGGPYVEMKAVSGSNCPPPGANLTVTPGFNAKFGVEARILGIPIGEQTLWGMDVPGAPLVKLGVMCGGQAAEPCAGKAEMYYCGAAIRGDPAFLYECRNGKTENKTPCPEGCKMAGDSATDFCQ